MSTHEPAALPSAERLKQMARHGHLTPEEAQILQNDPPPDDLAPLVLKVRERHARTRLAHALAEDSPVAARAEALLERVRHGEHDKGLRAAVTSLAKTPPRRGAETTLPAETATGEAP